MRNVRFRLALGLALALLVTLVLAGAVATSAAVTIELTDGDSCETDGASDGRTEATSEDVTDVPGKVTAVAGKVTECIARGGDDDGTAGSPPSGPG